MKKITDSEVYKSFKMLIKFIALMGMTVNTVAFLSKIFNMEDIGKTVKKIYNDITGLD